MFRTIDSDAARLAKLDSPILRQSFKGNLARDVQRHGRDPRANARGEAGNVNDATTGGNVRQRCLDEHDECPDVGVHDSCVALKGDVCGCGPVTERCIVYWQRLTKPHCHSNGRNAYQ